MTKVDENIQMAQNMLSGIVERCYELEEENRKLKEKLSEITMVADDEKQSIEHILELEEENKNLSEDHRIYEEGLEKKIVELQEENKKLKSDVSVYKSQRYAYKQKYLALLRANTELEEENRKLREELSKKNMETWFDKKAQNIFIDKSGKVIKGGEFTTLC